MKWLPSLLLIFCLAEYILSLTNANKRRNSLKSRVKVKAHQLANSNLLKEETKLPSYNGAFFAKMQNDGNLVVYSDGKKNASKKDEPKWHSATNGKGKAPYKLALQTDGNLCVIDNSSTPIWTSKTNGKGKGPYKMIMQDDGNLVLLDSLKAKLWESGLNNPPVPWFNAWR